MNGIIDAEKKTSLQRIKRKIENNPIAFALTGIGKLLHEELPAWRASVDNLTESVKELAKEMRKKNQNL